MSRASHWQAYLAGASAFKADVGRDASPYDASRTAGTNVSLPQPLADELHQHWLDGWDDENTLVNGVAWS